MTGTISDCNLVCGHSSWVISDEGVECNSSKTEEQNSQFIKVPIFLPISPNGEDLGIEEDSFIQEVTVGVIAKPVEVGLEKVARIEVADSTQEQVVHDAAENEIEIVQVPVTEETRNDEVTWNVDETEAVEGEELLTGEGVTLLVEEVHFVDSDSEDEELEIARERVRKWRNKRKHLKLTDVSDEGGEDPSAQRVVNEEDYVGSERESVYHSSDSDWSVRTYNSESDSSHDAAERRKLDWPQYDHAQPFLDFTLKLGFAGPTEFKEALSRYALKKQVDYKLTRNCTKKVSAVCKGKAGDDGPACRWRIYASWQTTDSVFRVKKYNNNHQCNPAFKNRRVTAGVIANQFRDRIDENPLIKSWQIQRLVKTHLKTEVQLSKCIRAKRMHSEEAMKKEKEEFGKLWSYVAELRDSAPENSVFVQTRRDEASEGIQFKRMYVCFYACKDGFLTGCRKFVGIDGCFLKGILKGELLTAIGIDANNQMFPIAWAVLE